MKHYGMMALMAIMILCSAATCTVSGDDNDRFNNYDNEQQLVGTSWKAVYFNDGHEWLDPKDHGCDFTITFYQYEYMATFTEQGNDGRVSTIDHIYQGQYTYQYNSIHCYDGNSSNESIRIDFTRTGNGQMEATVTLVREIKGTGDSSFREINDLSLRSLCFLHPDSQSLPELTNFKGQIKEVKGKICIFSTKLTIIN